MKFNKDWLEKRWVAYTIATCLAVILYVALIQFKDFANGFWRICGYFAPVGIGLVIAYVLDPLAVVLEKYVLKKIRKEASRRFWSVVLSLIVVIVFVVTLLLVLIPQVVDSVVTFVSNIDNYADAIQDLLEQLQEFTKQYNFDISNVVIAGNDLLDNISSELPRTINRVINTSYHIGMGVFLGIIAFIMAIYFLLDKEKLIGGVARFFRAVLTDKAYGKCAGFWRKCNTIMVRYIACDLLDGLIVGSANLFFMALLGMPYAVLISVVVGVTNLAPTFGPILGAVIGAFILVLNNPWHALWFLIFTIIIQTLDGYILKPTLFGDQLGVSSVWILICIIVGGRMFGVGGILLAIPFAAIVDYLYQEWLKEKERAKAGLDDEVISEEATPESKSENRMHAVKISFQKISSGKKLLNRDSSKKKAKTKEKPGKETTEKEITEKEITEKETTEKEITEKEISQKDSTAEEERKDNLSEDVQTEGLPPKQTQGRTEEEEK